MRDQDLQGLGWNAYDAHGPYDVDYSRAGPSSRPVPIPYDDPYAEEYAPESLIATGSSSAPLAHDDSVVSSRPNNYESERRGTGRGRGGARSRGQDRGRGNGRDRGNRNGARGRGNGQAYDSMESRSRGRGRGHTYSADSRHPQLPSPTDSQYPNPNMGISQQQRPPSPTSIAIARATGQYSDGTMFTSAPHQNAAPVPAPQQQWQYAQASPPFTFGQQSYLPQPFVQPHINPRFASALGFSPWGQPSYTTPSQPYIANSYPMSSQMVPQNGYNDSSSGTDRNVIQNGVPEENGNNDGK